MSQITPGVVLLNNTNTDQNTHSRQVSQQKVNSISEEIKEYKDNENADDTIEEYRDDEFYQPSIEAGGEKEGKMTPIV